MNTLRTISFLFLAMAAVVALAQGGKNVKPISPELLAKHKRANDAMSRGEQFLKENKLDQAIAAYREAVAIEKTYGYPVSGGNYELAKALTAMGREQEALAAYKQAFWWDPERRDLATNGPPFIHLGADYAILLAKHGKADEAKAVYHWTLRSLKMARGDFEPFPFLVVFDPDPDLVFWEYTPERLVAAATMLRAPDSGKAGRQMAEQVHEMIPEWIVPVMWMADRGGTKANRADLHSLALSLAKTDEERAWVQAYIDVANTSDRYAYGQDYGKVTLRWAEIGVARRKASIALEQARLDLEKNHPKVAAGVFH